MSAVNETTPSQARPRTGGVDLVAGLVMACMFLLQRYTIGAISLSSVVLVALVGYGVVVNEASSRGGRLKIAPADLAYPLFVLAFLYNLPLNYYAFDVKSVRLFLAPALLWVILVQWRRLTFRALTDARLLFVFLIVLGLLLTRDFGAMLGGGSVIKKIYGFANPNYTALLVGVLEVFYLSRERRHRIAGTIYILVSTLLIALTFSKGAYVMQVIIILSFFSRRNLAPLLGLSALIVLLALPFQADIGEMLDRAAIFFKQDWRQALPHRLDLTRAALEIFAEHPLLGIGRDQYIEQAYQFHGTFQQVHSHNILLTILAENGLVGLLLFVGSLTLPAMTFVADRANLRRRALLVLPVVLFALTHAGAETLIFMPLVFKTFDSSWLDAV